MHTCEPSDIYWTVENNTIGEAALVVIRDTGEENIPRTNAARTCKRLQGKTVDAKVSILQHKTKIEGCIIHLNVLVEQDKTKTLQVKGIVCENLKAFVAKRHTVSAAQPGETDDLVMTLAYCCYA